MFASSKTTRKRRQADGRSNNNSSTATNPEDVFGSNSSIRTRKGNIIVSVVENRAREVCIAKMDTSNVRKTKGVLYFALVLSFPIR